MAGEALSWDGRGAGPGGWVALAGWLSAWVLLEDSEGGAVRLLVLVEQRGREATSSSVSARPPPSRRRAVDPSLPPSVGVPALHVRTHTYTAVALALRQRTRPPVVKLIIKGSNRPTRPPARRLRSEEHEPLDPPVAHHLEHAPLSQRDQPALRPRPSPSPASAAAGAAGVEHSPRSPRAVQRPVEGHAPRLRARRRERVLVALLSLRCCRRLGRR